ncbi:hypothetical protein CEP51_008526 [Fusarium floridanum]|uniref:Uncharacterized protein n=1 Tax=Fusarium floridanum TaxID=1325733 RepID=A0A428RKM7_9HYPO|nr:hypothetical protein CEP51_008526 [Fusarium floridanum]
MCPSATTRLKKKYPITPLIISKQPRQHLTQFFSRVSWQSCQPTLNSGDGSERTESGTELICPPDHWSSSQYTPS